MLVATSTPGQPVPGLSARELQAFNRGMAVFATPFTQETGLGPLFNSNSCAACHDDLTPVAATPESQLGEQLFAQIRCTSCHVPVLRTGYSPNRALSGRRIRAYTDLLLHDMGPDEADICIGVARPEEFRTQPLMGVQFLDMFMHDGLAETIPEAIQRHGGEGSAARERFFALSPTDQAALVAFVSGL